MNTHTTRRPIHEEMVEPAADFFKHRIADSGLLEIAKFATGQNLRQRLAFQRMSRCCWRCRTGLQEIRSQA